MEEPLLVLENEPAKLRTLLIGPPTNVISELDQNLSDLVDLQISERIEDYPSRRDLDALVKRYTPDAILLNLADSQKASRVIADLSALQSRLSIIAIHSYCDQQLLLELMQSGVRELWFPPFQEDHLQQAVQRLKQHKAASMQPLATATSTIAFLPARSGSGTTTIAAHTGAALARNGHSVLLADFDFQNSVLNFWLKLQPKYTLVDAIRNWERLDPGIWSSIVLKTGGLDILCAPEARGPVIAGMRETSTVLDYASASYQFVLIDLPDVLYASCWEVIERANFTVLVTTPEIASLHLARQKLLALQSRGIPKSHIHLLVNRCSQQDLQPQEAAKFLAVEVLSTFGNDYRAVNNAFRNGEFVPHKSRLGAQFNRFAQFLGGGSRLLSPRSLQDSPSLLPKLKSLLRA